MFAVIKAGGKQYKVAKDDVVKVEKLEGEAGGQIAFEEVLLVGGETSLVGAPLVAGATVVGEVVEQTRTPKITVFKKKRRQNYRRRAGHRQALTVVRITEILLDGKKPAKQAEKAEAAPAPKAADKPADEAPAKAKPAAKKATAKAPAEKEAAVKKAPAKKPAAKKTKE